MTPFMYVALLFFIPIVLPGYFGPTPETLYELQIDTARGRSGERPPPCTVDDVEPTAEHPMTGKGKITNHNWTGKFKCQRKLFDYGERNSFYDYVSQHAPNRASRAAFALSQRLDSTGASGVSKREPWYINVRANDPVVANYVRSVFETELFPILPTGSLKRYSSVGSNANEIDVEVQTVDDPDLLFRVTAIPLGAQKEGTWAL
jgi:hypothetical protein